ncbi:TetR/AcrR family transcriptional regulator [Streptomyces sp. NPDC014894]|uniref:TetR/AcrR family transcriptional regulator n=1 Tax=Streptomyces sp. NPDC014894 TaxID=3364931 RepID=UPI0036F6BDB8
MPLPRFHRLPPERREHILSVAQRHFAEHGPEAASYNKIIEAVGFSKTAAYQYFDSRDDLLSAVLDGVRERLFEALGPWSAADRADAFWERLETGSRALVTHLHTHPDDLALAGAALARSGPEGWLQWFEAVVENGQRLGVVRTDTDRGLLVAATAAVFRAADEWTLARMRPPGTPDTAPLPSGDGADRQVWSLLRGLWTAPGDRAREPGPGPGPGPGRSAHDEAGTG